MDHSTHPNDSSSVDNALTPGLPKRPFWPRAPYHSNWGRLSDFLVGAIPLFLLQWDSMSGNINGEDAGLGLGMYEAISLPIFLAASFVLYLIFVAYTKRPLWVGLGLFVGNFLPILLKSALLNLSRR